nr:aminoglycoside phosphotransferase family protein [Bacteroidota bacterium]
MMGQFSKDNIINNVLPKFRLSGTVEDVRPMGDGHINDTFFVKTLGDVSPDYVLQRINHYIFTDVKGLMANFEKVTSHIEKKVISSKRTEGSHRQLKLIYTVEGASFYKDEDDSFWRCLLFCRNHPYKETEISPARAYEGGRALGNFQQMLSDLPEGSLIETIPDFHNLSYRLDQFHRSIEGNPVNRLSSAEAEVEKVMARSEELLVIHNLLESGKNPKRITHNDTKFNNILFDENEKAICLIDLDTVMEGYAIHDFGDAIRTLSNTAEEDESDLTKVNFDMNLFESFSEGYLKEAKSFLMVAEIDLLAISCQFLTYIIAVRFLTDYIGGDTYFKVSYPTHNLVRAKNQLKLLESMHQSYTEMVSIIRQLTRD